MGAVCVGQIDGHRKMVSKTTIRGLQIPAMVGKRYTSIRWAYEYGWISHPPLPPPFLDFSRTEPAFE